MPTTHITKLAYETKESRAALSALVKLLEELKNAGANTQKVFNDLAKGNINNVEKQVDKLSASLGRGSEETKRLQNAFDQFKTVSGTITNLYAQTQKLRNIDVGVNFEKLNTITDTLGLNAAQLGRVWQADTGIMERMTAQTNALVKQLEFAQNTPFISDKARSNINSSLDQLKSIGIILENNQKIITTSSFEKLNKSLPKEEQLAFIAKQIKLAAIQAKEFKTNLAGTKDTLGKGTADSVQKAFDVSHLREFLQEVRNYGSIVRKIYADSDKSGKRALGPLRKEYGALTGLLNETLKESTKLENKYKDMLIPTEKLVGNIRMQGSALREVTQSAESGFIKVAQAMGGATTQNMQNLLRVVKLVNTETGDLYATFAKQSANAKNAYKEEIALLHQKRQILIDTGSTPEVAKEAFDKGMLQNAKQYAERLSLVRNEQMRTVASLKEWLNLVAQNKKNTTVEEYLKMVDALKAAESALKSTGAEYEKTANQARRLQANMDQVAKSKGIPATTSQVRDFSAQMDIAIQKIIRYRIAFQAIQKVFQGFKSTLSVPVALESEFAQVAKVLTDVNANLGEIENAAFGMASVFGTEIKGVIQAMFVWAQQGKTQNEILELTRTSLLGVVAANLTASQSTEVLTSAIRQFNIPAEESAIIMDKLLNVQRNFAVTAPDLADSMKLLGATAVTLGLSIDSLFGSITAVAEITRKTGKAVANSLKTVFARIVKKDAVQALRGVGVAVHDVNGELRPLDDTLDDLSLKWDMLTRAERLNLAQVIGGIRRYNDFIVLMDNYGTKLKATAISSQSLGAAQDAANIELETLKRTLKSISVQFTVIADSIGNATFGFKTLAAAAKPLTDFFVNSEGQISDGGKAFAEIAAGALTFASALGIVTGATWLHGRAQAAIVQSMHARNLAGIEIINITGQLTKQEAQHALATQFSAREFDKKIKAVLRGQPVMVATAKGTFELTKNNLALAAAYYEVAKGKYAATAAPDPATGAAIARTVAKAGFVGTFAKSVASIFNPASLGLTLLLVFLPKIISGLTKTKDALKKTKDETHTLFIEQRSLANVYKSSTSLLAKQLITIEESAQKLDTLDHKTKNYTLTLEALNSQVARANDILSLVGVGVGPIVKKDSVENAKQLSNALEKIRSGLLLLSKTSDDANKRMVEYATSFREFARVELGDLESQANARRQLNDGIANTTKLLSNLFSTTGKTTEESVRALNYFTNVLGESIDEVAKWQKQLANGQEIDLQSLINVALETGSFDDTRSAVLALYGSMLDTIENESSKFSDETKANLKKNVQEALGSIINPQIAVEFQQKLQALSKELNKEQNRFVLFGKTIFGGDPDKATKEFSTIFDGKVVQEFASIISALNKELFDLTNKQTELKKQTIEADKAIVQTGKSMGILSYTAEEMSTAINESFTSVANVRSQLQSLDKQLEISRDLMFATGGETSLFEQQSRSLKQMAKQLEEAYHTQVARFALMNNEENLQELLNKGLQSGTSIALDRWNIEQNTLKTQIDGLKKIKESSRPLTVEENAQLVYAKERLATFQGLISANENILSAEVKTKATAVERAQAVYDYTKSLVESGKLSKEELDIAEKVLEIQKENVGEINVELDQQQEVLLTLREELDILHQQIAARQLQIGLEKTVYDKIFDSIKRTVGKRQEELKLAKSINDVFKGLSDEESLRLKQNIDQQSVWVKAIDTTKKLFDQYRVPLSDIVFLTQDATKTQKELFEEVAKTLRTQLGGGKAVEALIESLRENLEYEQEKSAALQKQEIILQNVIAAEKTITEIGKKRLDFIKSYYSEVKSVLGLVSQDSRTAFTTDEISSGAQQKALKDYQTQYIAAFRIIGEAQGRNTKEIDAQVENIQARFNIEKAELDIIQKYAALQTATRGLEENSARAASLELDAAKELYDFKERTAEVSGASERELLKIRLAGIQAQKNAIISNREDNQARINSLQLEGVSVEDLEIKTRKYNEQLQELDIQAQKLTLDTKFEEITKEIEKATGVTSRLFDIVGSTLPSAVDTYISRLDLAVDKNQEIFDKKKEIAELEQQLANEVDSTKRLELVDDLQIAKKELGTLNEEANELKSIWDSLVVSAGDFAKSISDLVIEVNQEQLKELLTETISQTTQQKIANAISGGIIDASAQLAKNTFDPLEKLYAKLAETHKTEADQWANTVANQLVELRSIYTDLNGILMESARLNAIAIATANSNGGDVPQETLDAIDNVFSKYTSPQITELQKNTQSLTNAARTYGAAAQAFGAIGSELSSIDAGKALQPTVEQLGIEDASKKAENLGKTFTLLAQQVANFATVAAFDDPRRARRAQVGNSFGQIAGTVVGGPVGGIVGSVLGGLLGGIFGPGTDDPEPEPTRFAPTIENTDAMMANTVSLNKLTVAMNDIREALINAPSTFTLPAGAGGGITGGGGGVTIIQVQTPEQAVAVARAGGADYANQKQRQGIRARLT